MTATALWLRIVAGLCAAAGSVLLIPVSIPSHDVSLVTAALVGCAGGIVLFTVLARASPGVHRGTWSRRDTTRASFLVLWATVEELLWRRLALGGLAPHAGWLVALVVSSGAFAAVHRWGRASQLVTGIGFGTVYLATGRLLASIAMHAVYNLLLDQAQHRPLAAARAP